MSPFPSVSVYNPVIVGSNVSEDLLLEKKDLSEKTEGFWVGISRYHDEMSGGYIYTFKLRDDYNDINSLCDQKKILLLQKQVNQDLFPAVQMHPGLLLFLDATTEKHVLFQEMFKRYAVFYGGFRFTTREIGKGVNRLLDRADLFLSLGYKMNRTGGETFLDCPDATVLLARWGVLQKTISGLPSLHIIQSEGVAKDSVFVDAFVNGGILLSSGKEFLHDHTNHIIATILRIVEHLPTQLGNDFFSYDQAQKSVRQCVKQWQEHIRTIGCKAENDESLEGVQALLSATVDSVTSESSNSKFKNVLCQVHQIFESNEWGGYMTRRFGEGWKKNIQPLWDEVERLGTVD